jgi:transcriptional regulator with XRE-family HTH domain
VSLNIRAGMARAGVNQTQLAEALGMRQAGVSDRLRGRVPWTVDQLVTVADVLGCRPSQLLPDDAARRVA